MIKLYSNLNKNINTGIKNPYPLTLQLNGSSQGEYDGSGAKTVNITASGIGASPSNHSHSEYLIQNQNLITEVIPFYTGGIYFYRYGRVVFVYISKATTMTTSSSIDSSSINSNFKPVQNIKTLFPVYETEISGTKNTSDISLYGYIEISNDCKIKYRIPPGYIGFSFMYFV